MSQPNKKSPRQFQCRNGLWSTFEVMASELECSVDYLINDAMKQYARQRGYANEPSTTGNIPPSAPGPSATSGALPPPVPALSRAAAPPHPSPLPPLHSPAVAPLRPPVSQAAPPPPAPKPPGLPPPGRPLSSTARQTVPLSPDRLPPMPPAQKQPPPLPAPLPPAPSAALSRPAAVPVARALTIHYQGQPFLVTKDRFVIGRGKTSSDLTIKDPNVSRQHALVEFSGGHFYMVDMGSTNGIEFSGQRVQRKAIQNGDVFRICEHELFCSMG